MAQKPLINAGDVIEPGEVGCCGMKIPEVREGDFQCPLCGCTVETRNLRVQRVKRCRAHA